MFKALLAAHLVLAVFAVGPLVHAATTAARGVRTGDGAATASAARLLRIYSAASVLVVLVGFGVMSAKAPWNPNEHVAEISDTWVWVSLLLWVLAMAVVHGVAAPTLVRASERIAAQDSVVALTGRVAAAGGVVALLFLAIVVLMVYQPGG
jgi:predicted membrane protein